MISDELRVDGHGMLVVNDKLLAQQISDDFQQALVTFGAISSDEHDRDKSKCEVIFDLMNAPFFFHKWLYYCYKVNGSYDKNGIAKGQQ